MEMNKSTMYHISINFILKEQQKLRLIQLEKKALINYICSLTPPSYESPCDILYTVKNDPVNLTDSC